MQRREPIRWLRRVRHAPVSPPADPIFCWFRHCHLGRPPSPASRASRWRGGPPIDRRPTHRVWFLVASWLATSRAIWYMPSGCWTFFTKPPRITDENGHYDQFHYIQNAIHALLREY